MFFSKWHPGTAIKWPEQIFRFILSSLFVTISENRHFQYLKDKGSQAEYVMNHAIVKSFHQTSGRIIGLMDLVIICIQYKHWKALPSKLPTATEQGRI